MMKHQLLSAAIAAAALASPAMAQEKVPFSGARAGVEAGWGRLGGERIASDGFTYGATLGYDIAANRVRIGPELAISDATQKECRAAPALGAGASRCERSDRDLYAGVRLGFVASPKLMVFGKAGYTNARFSDRTERPNVARLETADDHGGYRLGAGVEYALTPAAYVTGEYRYSHWSDDIHQNQLLAGVGVRF